MRVLGLFPGFLGLWMALGRSPKKKNAHAARRAPLPALPPQTGGAEGYFEFEPLDEKDTRPKWRLTGQTSGASRTHRFWPYGVAEGSQSVSGAPNARAPSRNRKARRSTPPLGPLPPFHHTPNALRTHILSSHSLHHHHHHHHRCVTRTPTARATTRPRASGLFLFCVGSARGGRLLEREPLLRGGVTLKH